MYGRHPLSIQNLGRRLERIEDPYPTSREIGDVSRHNHETVDACRRHQSNVPTVFVFVPSRRVHFATIGPSIGMMRSENDFSSASMPSRILCARSGSRFIRASAPRRFSNSVAPHSVAPMHIFVPTVLQFTEDIFIQ